MARKAGNITSNGGGSSPKKKAAVKSSNSSGGKSSRATKAPKRIRRKCSAPNCDNRVVQGGVCVTHGAKRKLCSHPGCDKAVKLAGACSTHGPARKKCDTQGCTRVAVQGGKCLSHGARRKICNYPCVGGKKPCERNAIMGGMCKKHYDHVQNAESMLEMSYCVPVRSESMANKKDDSSSSSSGESDEEVVKSNPSPAWTGAAPEFAGSSSTTAMANTAPPPMATSYHPGYAQAPSFYYAPETAYGPSYGMISSSYRQPKKIATRPGHQRGLSIFDEMNTVNAIIGTSGTEYPTTAQYPHHPPQYQQQVSSYQHSQAQAAAATAVRMPSMSNASSKSTTTGFKRQNSLNTKTPATQVSFADGTRKPSNGEKPCTGDASCTCDACRSPTLAIFEQMIQASQRIDSGDIDTDKYIGLSPPKLSPRKAAKEEKKAGDKQNSAGAIKVGPKSPSPKNVSFMEEEPTSSGSVVIRKVSNNNMEGRSSTTTQYADYHQGQESRQDSPKRGEGPASHALVAMAIRDSEAESGSRTVSYDVDDSRQRRQYYSQHPPPPQSGAHYGHHPQHHPPPQHHYYQYPPHHGHAPPAYGPHYAPPAYHQVPYQQPPHHAYSAPAAHFQPPQTPSLYDTKSSQGPQEVDSSSAAVVSSHSAHQDQQLLPKRREDIDHLFIPKEV